MLRVIGVVALLAQGPEVGWVAVFGCVVEVGYCEDNLHFLTCFGVEPHSMVFNSAELATVIGSFQNACSYLLPITGIARTVFWPYRHRSLI